MPVDTNIADPYLFLIVFIGVAVAFPLIPLALARSRVIGTGASTIPGAIPSVLHHLSDIRCRSNFPGAVCRGVYRIARRRFCRDSRVPGSLG